MKLIKHIVSILSLSLLFAASSNAQDRAWSGKNWMSLIPDYTYICSLSIPGTHDSCTYTIGPMIDQWGLTQTYSLKEQFDGGVRVFDIRPRYYMATDDNGNKIDEWIEICHGPLDCGISLGGVLEELTSSVRNTQEFIIMILSYEGSLFTKAAVMIQELMGEYRSMFVEFRPDLTVGEARGKIIVLNRDDYDPKNGPVIGAFLNGYPACGTATISKDRMLSKGGTESCKVYIQDTDHYPDKEDFMEYKGCKFQATFENYQNDRDFFVWCINHTSAWCGDSGATMDYNENSLFMNEWAYKYLKSNYSDGYHLDAKGKWRGAGIIMMDFALEDDFSICPVFGDILVDTVIDMNF